MFMLRGIYCIVDHSQGLELREKPVRVHRIIMLYRRSFSVWWYSVNWENTHTVCHPASVLCSLELPLHNTFSLTFIGNIRGGKLLLDGLTATSLWIQIRHWVLQNDSNTVILSPWYAGEYLVRCLEEPDIKLGILMCQNSVWYISTYSKLWCMCWLVIFFVQPATLLSTLMKLNFHAVKHPKAS